MAGLRWVTERRVLRRASHQSLKVPVFREQSFDTLSQNTPAASYARGDWDADYRRDARDEHWLPAEVERGAPATSVRELSRPAPTAIADDSWIAADPHHRSDREPVSPTPAANTLTFKAAARPWYGSRRVVLLVGAAAVIAMMVAVGLLVARNLGDGNEEPTFVTPTAVTPTTTNSAIPQPAPPPGAVGEPLAPGDVPPPPADASNSAPANTGGYPRRPTSPSDGTPTGRPQTPAQISATPSVKPPSSVGGHSAPGDAPGRHHGFFG